MGNLLKAVEIFENMTDEDRRELDGWISEQKQYRKQQEKLLNGATIRRRISCVYCIVNIHNGKAYVGQTGRIDKRIQQHLASLKGGYHISSEMQKDFNKYGVESFRVRVLEELNDIGKRKKREEQYIEHFRRTSGVYNTMKPNCEISYKQVKLFDIKRGK